MSTAPVAASIVVQRAAVPARGLPSADSLRRFAAAALPKRPLEMTIRIVDEAESRALNHRYRGKDKPTNVLSFHGEGWGDDGPDGPHPTIVSANGSPLSRTRERDGGRRFATKLVLGDLVICAPVVAREAAEQSKLPRAHWAHMVVHGCLHLQGYDHEADADAARMEARETRILKTLGFDNPYS